MKGYKGFDKDLKCSGFQYEVGGSYECEGDIKACKRGFHFCENPLDVLKYYAPADSRYCEVESDGVESRDTDDSKVATSRLHVKTEIGLSGLIDAGVKFILDKVNWDCNKATNTGDRSAASVSGKQSVAMAIGCESKAKGALGCWIVVSEWEDNGIKDVQCSKVDGDRIKPDTYYMLRGGEFIEVE